MSTQSTESILTFSSVTVAYRGTPVVRELSASINSGSFVALLGPNGAGKSSILKSVMRLVELQAGEIYVEGQRVEALSQLDLARRIAYVPQKFGVDLPIKVIEFLLMARYAHLAWSKGYTQHDQQIALDAINICQIEALKDRTIDTLSGGERQLVLIAAALTQEPKLILLDEPTTFLDPLYQGRVLEVLSRARKESGLTLVMATHDINLAALNVDRVLAISAGKLLYDLPASEIVDNRYLEPIYARKFAIAQHPSLAQALILPDRV